MDSATAFITGANCRCFQQKTPENYAPFLSRCVSPSALGHRLPLRTAEIRRSHLRVQFRQQPVECAHTNPVGPPSTSCAHSAGCTRTCQCRSFPEFPCRRVGRATDASSAEVHSLFLVEPDTVCGLVLADHRWTCGRSNLPLSSTIGDGSGGMDRLECGHELIDGFVHLVLVLRCAARVIVS